ncbi:Cof-type HAD-IIB family hydrolase [Candidatus Mycoplasma mahonii]|uniref:Cof-type HAD-IIB family hydrolase n=1 Tax=Candidatus Mycoplasma mahonii TaxID=3004105 RepID=UPI0026ECDE57|nr:Cof-type HAD-IIB family hydrolase [Candidatus Mycoplasma mahonii]WKX02467.1 Cof-type HAD-IIB family hydrolase [Candidatus Mycoplasma mahonii]
MNKKLFAFDLDGTLLSNSQFGKIPENTINIIKNIREQGHVVCILTGRPWKATKDIYKKLDLNTLVANYNGGHIHNPTDYDFLPIIRTMKATTVMKIISSLEILKIAKNIAIEITNETHIQNNTVDFFTQTFIKGDGTGELFSPIKWENVVREPSGVLIEVKTKYAKDMDHIKKYFHGLYGDEVSFSYWDTGEGREPILEFTNKSARKDMALIKMARYYDIKMKDVVAFGDGFNDVEMLKTAGVGVAMNNASDNVKTFANVITKHSNKDGGVAKFIKWYLKGGHKKVNKVVYDFKTIQTEPIKES